MKKLLYILGFLMLATGVVSPFAVQGQQFSGKDEDLPYSSARIFSKVVAATGANPDANWSDSFGAGNEADIGKDLYMIIYSKTENAPQKEAHKNVAAKYGMTEADLIRILQGDYSPIIAKKPTLTQEEFQRKVVEIQQKFKEEKELLNLRANISAAVETNEIFANGDLDDSGFDIINDLQIIEKILFLKSNPIDIGAAYDGGDEEEAAPPAAPPGMPPPAPGEYQDPTIPLEGSSGSDSFGDSGQDSETAGGESGDGSSQVPKSGQGPDFNPNSCFANGEYDKALEEFMKKAEQDSNYVNKSGSDQLPGTQDNDQTSGEGQLGVDSSAGADFLPEIPQPPAPPAKPAPADEWLKDVFCPGVLCLEVEFVKKPATSAFQSSDNCISCHVQKTNDILKDVINHTLAPNKAPGNLGESAKCKDSMGVAFSSISMNVYVVPMPVKTPINDDLIYGSTIEDEWQIFCNAVSFFPFDECAKPKTQGQQAKYEIPPSITDTVSKKEIANSSSQTSASEVVNNISRALQGYTIKRDEEITKTTSSKESGDKVLSFNPLKTEMDNMNLYFNNISDILHSLHEEVSSVPGMQACTELNNKKECK